MKPYSVSRLVPGGATLSIFPAVCVAGYPYLQANPYRGVGVPTETTVPRLPVCIMVNGTIRACRCMPLPVTIMLSDMPGTGTCRTIMLTRQLC